MGAAELRQETYLPEADGRELAKFYDLLSAHEAAGKGHIAPRYRLVGPDLGEQVEIPPEAWWLSSGSQGEAVGRDRA